MFLLKSNERHGKKFIFSGMMFGMSAYYDRVRRSSTYFCLGFCVTRVLATSLRMACATYPHSIHVATAALVSVYAGVCLLFVANLFFAQRIVRAQHPYFGWSRTFDTALPVLLFVIIGTIISLIGGIVLGSCSGNSTVAVAVRGIQLYGSTVYAIVAFIPIPIVTISTLTHRHLSVKKNKAVDRFGESSISAKVAIVAFSAVFLTLGATFRSCALWLSSIPVVAGDSPITTPWYSSRGSFYAFNFGIELFIAWFWLIVRIDKHFIIPNGAKGPYSYSRGLEDAGEAENEKVQLSNWDSTCDLKSSHISGFDSKHGSRISWASGDGSCLSVASHMTWDAVWRGSASDDLSEDVDEVLMYYQDEEMSQIDSDFDVCSVEQETGWDAQSDQWPLRPASGLLSCYMR